MTAAVLHLAAVMGLLVLTSRTEPVSCPPNSRNCMKGPGAILGQGSSPAPGIRVCFCAKTGTQHTMPSSHPPQSVRTLPAHPRPPPPCAPPPGCSQGLSTAGHVRGCMSVLGLGDLTAEMCSPTVLGAGSPRSRWQQGWFLLRPLTVAGGSRDACHLFLCPHVAVPLHVCVLIPS